MSSVNPRASGLWSTSSRMSYVSVQQSDEGDDLDVEGLGFDAPDEFDGRTPLDRFIDRIGMGEPFLRLSGLSHELRGTHPSIGREPPVDASLPLRFR